MSTNYYFRVKEEGDQTLGGLSEIHIGQYAAQSCLLMRQDKFYHTVDEMASFYFKHMNSVDIVNEYDQVISWELLQERLLSSGPRRGHLYFRDESNYSWTSEDFS